MLNLCIVLQFIAVAYLTRFISYCYGARYREQFCKCSV